MNFDDPLIKLVVPEGFSGRLDSFLHGYLPQNLDLSRSKIKAHILSGNVWLHNEQVTEVAKKLKPFETISFLIPKPKVSEIIPQNLDLDIIFEDQHILVINKPAGMVVHPGSGVSDGTLVNALLYHCGDKISSVGGFSRPGIVHRLDKLTSGVLVVAKTERAYQKLVPQFANHSIIRRYSAIIWGQLKRSFKDGNNTGTSFSNDGDKVRICSNIGRHPYDRKKMSVLTRKGKIAISKFREENKFFIDGDKCASLIECELETGRTHQIRVHLSYIGNPIIGDPTYGRKQKISSAINSKMKVLQDFKRQALHASFLGLKHPVTKKLLSFEAGPPEDFKNVLQILDS